MKKSIIALLLAVVTGIGARAQEDEILSFFEDENGKFGMQNQAGKIIVAAKYDAVLFFDFSEGLTAVNIGGEKQSVYGIEGIGGGKWGYVDQYGKEIIPLQYESASNFSEGLAAIKLNGKSGYIDKKGKVIIPTKYEWAGDFSEGLAVIGINPPLSRLYGYIDKTGKEVIPAKYTEAASFENGKAKVRISDNPFEEAEKFYIDKTGKEVK